MRKLLFICLLVPLVGFSQVKNVLNATRVFAKQDKITEFEKALANHAQKYHTGDWKWRVWSIESGPDAGGYMITEGPDSWSQLDSRGDLGAEHTADWEKNVAPLTQDRSGITTYTEFQPDLSTVQLTDFSDKIVITHILARPGKIGAIPDLIKKQKNVQRVTAHRLLFIHWSLPGGLGYLTVTRPRMRFEGNGIRLPKTIERTFYCSERGRLL